MPYQQLGEFSNILQAVEGVKGSLPHTRQTFDDGTIRNLKFLKKVQDPRGLTEPGRTVKILRQYQGQIHAIRAASQAEAGRGSQGLNKGVTDAKSNVAPTSSMLFGLSNEAEEEKYREL